METTTMSTIQTTFNVSHDVQDFEKWHAAYLQNSDVSNRLGVLRNIDNPNNVFVGEKTTDHRSAKSFLQSDDLKNLMKDSGVISVPKIKYLNLIQFQPASIDINYRVSISHEVRNLEEWKEVFDQDEEERVAYGIQVSGLGTSEDNPSEVFIMFAVKDIDKANDYFNKPELKDLMNKAGVISKPDFNYWKMF